MTTQSKIRLIFFLAGLFALAFLTTAIILNIGTVGMHLDASTFN